VFVAAPLAGIGSVAAAAECPQPNSPIETDRPDVTNSPIVVPAGSLQSENGTDTSRDHGADILNGTNSRLRLGIAPCLEVLVDVPNYVATLRGVGPSGFSDVVPAVKWQISPLPGKFDLSLTVGAALPTGATGVAGSGVQPYVQVPWSIDLGAVWALNGNGDRVLCAVLGQEIHLSIDAGHREGYHQALICVRRICRQLSERWWQ